MPISPASAPTRVKDNVTIVSTCSAVHVGFGKHQHALQSAWHRHLQQLHAGSSLRPQCAGMFCDDRLSNTQQVALPANDTVRHSAELLYVHHCNAAFHQMNHQNADRTRSKATSSFRLWSRSISMSASVPSILSLRAVSLLKTESTCSNAMYVLCCS